MPLPRRLDSFRGRQPCSTRPRLMPPARGPTDAIPAPLTSRLISSSHLRYILPEEDSTMSVQAGKPSTIAEPRRTTGAGGTRTGSPSSRLSGVPHWRALTDTTDLDPYLARAMDPEQGPRKPATSPCSAPGTPADKAPAPLRCRRTGRDAHHQVVFHCPAGQRGDNVTHGKGENHLMGGATRAEAIDYLSHAYGPVFVGVLIKHLPNPRRCWAA